MLGDLSYDEATLKFEGKSSIHSLTSADMMSIASLLPGWGVSLLARRQMNYRRNYFQRLTLESWYTNLEQMSTTTGALQTTYSRRKRN